jgi:hypothetical protein
MPGDLEEVRRYRASACSQHALSSCKMHKVSMPYTGLCGPPFYATNDRTIAHRRLMREHLAPPYLFVLSPMTVRRHALPITLHDIKSEHAASEEVERAPYDVVTLFLQDVDKILSVPEDGLTGPCSELHGTSARSYLRLIRCL